MAIMVSIFRFQITTLSPSELVKFSRNRPPGMNRNRALGTRVIVLSSLAAPCWLRVPARSS